MVGPTNNTHSPHLPHLNLSQHSEHSDRKESDARSPTGSAPRLRKLSGMQGNRNNISDLELSPSDQEDLLTMREALQLLQSPRPNSATVHLPPVKRAVPSVSTSQMEDISFSQSSVTKAIQSVKASQMDNIFLNQPPIKRVQSTQTSQVNTVLPRRLSIMSSPKSGLPIRHGIIPPFTHSEASDKSLDSLTKTRRSIDEKKGTRS